MTIVIDPQLAPPSGLTLDDIVARVRSELGDNENLNVLAESISADDTTLLLSHPMSQITTGTRISIDDETVHVWSAVPETGEVRVLRGYQSASSPHSSGSLIIVGGKSRRQIVDSINDELMSLWGKGLYQMRSIPLDGYSPAVSSYELDELEDSDIYDVQYRDVAQASEWVHIPDWRQGSIDNTVTITNSWLPSTHLRVLYKVPFVRLTDGGDDIQAASGLHSEAVDILVWGALLRLTATEELKRNQFRSQGDTRRPEEVPYRAVSLARNDIRQTLDERIQQERDRLRRRFPHRKSGF